MAKNLKIAYILEKFPSPTERFILNEILQMEKKGMEIVILVLRKQSRYLGMPEISNIRSSIIYLPWYILYFPFISLLPVNSLSFLHFSSAGSAKFLSISFFKQVRNYFFSLYFARKLKGIDIRHIHAHFAFIGVDVASVLSKLLRIKYSFTAHAQDIYTNEAVLKQHLISSAFVLTCTKYNGAYINQITEKRYRGKIFEVYHGIDLAKWPPVKREPKNTSVFHILSIARLVEKKGLKYLIEAIEILIKQGIEVHCSIVGEGPLKNELDEYVKAKKIEGFVQFLPFANHDKIRELLALADVFVLPCIIAANGDRDGIPNTIIEAMLNGLPVVSTSVSGIPEVIIHKETGILVKEKDGTAIAEAVKLLKNDKALLHQINVNASKKICEEFDIENSTKKLIEIFEQNIPQ